MKQDLLIPDMSKMMCLPLFFYLASSTWGEYPRAEADLPSLVQDIFSRTAEPPRGERWPLIPGPAPHVCNSPFLSCFLSQQIFIACLFLNPNVPFLPRQHRVCIVGAGPAGVHMAKLLKDRNFTRVVLLEKTDRVSDACDH